MTYYKKHQNNLPDCNICYEKTFVKCVCNKCKQCWCSNCDDKIHSCPYCRVPIPGRAEYPNSEVTRDDVELLIEFQRRVLENIFRIQ